MGRTKKVGASGSFGMRYGRSVKKKYNTVMAVRKAKHKCPNCLNPTLTRPASGIWECRKCGHKMAGKAYRPS